MIGYDINVVEKGYVVKDAESGVDLVVQDENVVFSDGQMYITQNTYDHLKKDESLLSGMN